MKIYFFRLKGNKKVIEASPFQNDVYKAMENYPYHEIRLYTTSISPCVYALYKMGHMKDGVTTRDSFWYARYIEENEGLAITRLRKPSKEFLGAFCHERRKI